MKELSWKSALLFIRILMISWLFSLAFHATFTRTQKLWFKLQMEISKTAVSAHTLHGWEVYMAHTLMPKLEFRFCCQSRSKGSKKYDEEIFDSGVWMRAAWNIGSSEITWIKRWYNFCKRTPSRTFFPDGVQNSLCPGKVIQDKLHSETKQTEKRLRLSLGTWRTFQIMSGCSCPSMRQLICMFPRPRTHSLMLSASWKNTCQILGAYSDELLDFEMMRIWSKEVS